MQRVKSEISTDEVRCFRRAGYVVLKNFFDIGVTERIRELSDKFSIEATAILEQCYKQGDTLSGRVGANTDELIIVPEVGNKRILCRYEYMIGSSIEFKQFIDKYVVPPISVILSELALPFKDKTNEKLPGGGAFRPHQDFVAYQHFGPRYNITAMLTIHLSTRENGCLQFAENFVDLVKEKPHLVRSTVIGCSILHYHEGGLRHGDIIDEAAKDLVWLKVETEPRDLVLFDSYVPHYSEPNLSASPRRAVFVTFNGQHEGDWYQRYYRAKRANYHDPIFHVSTPTRYETDRDHDHYQLNRAV